jgi:hypothetical protein
MNPFFKDLIQVLTWLVAAIGGLIAAFKAIAEMRQGNKDREEQFRWRQAEMAQTILDRTWNDELAKSALKMLDWSGLKYERKGGFTGHITHEEMWRALRVQNTTFTDDEQFVRDCFDKLFDDFGNIQHYLNIGLINWKDVEARLNYYVILLAERKKVYKDFLETYQFDLALQLLDRFPKWLAAEHIS